MNAQTAREYANTVVFEENRISELQDELLAAEGDVNLLEFEYLLSDYSGKTAQQRDAQREYEMSQNTVLVTARERVQRIKRDLRDHRIWRDSAERYYKIALAELRADAREA